MSQSAIEFIKKIESKKTPENGGLYIYEGGFFSMPIGYRFNRKLNEWEWSNDLYIWNSIHMTIDDEIYCMSSDNIYIINYLRLKSKSKNIKDMENHLEALRQSLHNLYSNTSIFDPINIEDEQLRDDRVQDYIHQISFERGIYENQLSQLTAIELEYTQEQGRIRTRNSLKSMDTHYQTQLDSLKLQIIESRFKLNHLIAELQKYICGLKTKKDNDLADDLLLNYKLEDEVIQACNFLEGRENFINNQNLANSFTQFKKRLLKLLGLPETNESLEQVISKYVENRQFVECTLYKTKAELEETKKMNNLLRTDNESSKKDYSLIEKHYLIQKNQMDALNVELFNIKNETHSSLLRIGTLESQVTDLENIRSTLIIEKEQMDKTIKQIDYEKTQSINSLKQKNRELIEKILTIQPDLIYNEEEGVFQNREDTYDIINLEDE